jgi:tetratricopeptide (TPR) repeat protein
VKRLLEIALAIAPFLAFPGLAFPGAASARPQTPPPAESFALGVQAYRAGDAAAARALWLHALSAGEVNVRSETLYNLGNAAWREKKPLEAVAWYTACIRLAPRHRDAWANLEFARSAAGLEPADRGDLAATADRLLHLLTLAESEWLVLAGGALLVALLAAQAWSGGAVLRRLALVSCALVALSIPPWIANLRRSTENGLFVLAPEGAAVLSEPRPDAALLSKLPPASIVQGRDKLPGWVRVASREGARELDGWVREDAVFALAR